MLSGSDNIEAEDIDIKTETLEDGENINMNPDWHVGIKQNGLDRVNGLNNMHDFDESSDSNTITFRGISVTRIKNEPMEFRDATLNDQNGHFNAKKRKLSNSSIADLNITANDSNLDNLDQNRDDAAGKRTRKKIVNNYTPSQLQEALDLVHSENLSILNAAKQYGIPRSTLRRYALTVWAAAAPKTRGKQETALSPPQEAHIVSMISKMSRAGKYVSTMDVKSTVQHLLDESKRIVFKDRNRPTAGWVQRFRKRHQHLPLKGSGYTIKKPAPQSKDDVNEWYKDITNYLINDWDINPSVIFSDDCMNRVFNLDEISIYLNRKVDLVDENVVGAHKNDDNFAEVTVLTAVSAAGEFMQPLIIQKGEGGGHDDDIMPLDQSSYGISFSISGKLNSEIFIRWLEAFDRELTEKGVQKPIVIFLDDVFSHFHISVFSFAIDNDIILLCLQSPSLQPIEAEISEKVKESYRALCKDQYRLEQCPINMDSFPETFFRAWEIVKEEEGVKERIESSFAYFGLLPFIADCMAFADLPLCNEEPVKTTQKSEGRSRSQKEPKAKKTASPKAISINGSECADLGNLLSPTVKIKKLENHLKIEPYKIPTKSPSTTGQKTQKPSPSSLKNGHTSFQITKTDPPKPKVQKLTPPLPATPGKAQSLSHDRLLGRQDGINKCLDLMESFIPSDIIGVWRTRTDDLKSSSEIPYCMWKTISKMMSSMKTQVRNKARESGSSSNSPRTKSFSHDSFINPLDYLECGPYNS